MADAEREAEIRQEALLQAANALGELTANHDWPFPDRVALERAFVIVVAARRRDRAAVKA